MKEKQRRKDRKGLFCILSLYKPMIFFRQFIVMLNCGIISSAGFYVELLIKKERYVYEKVYQ